MPVVYSKLLPVKVFRFEKSRMLTFTRTSYGHGCAIHAHYGFVSIGRQRVECVFCGVVRKILKSDTSKHLDQALLGAHRKGCPLISGLYDQSPNVPMIRTKIETRKRQKVFSAKYEWQSHKANGIQNVIRKKKQKRVRPTLFPKVFLSEWKRLETFQKCEEVLQAIKAARHGLVWVGGSYGQCIFCNRIGKLQKFSFINENYHTVSCPMITEREVENEPIGSSDCMNEGRPIIRRASFEEVGTSTMSVVMLEGLLLEEYRPDILKRLTIDYFMENGLYPSRSTIIQRYQQYTREETGVKTLH